MLEELKIKTSTVDKYKDIIKKARERVRIKLLEKYCDKLSNNEIFEILLTLPIEYREYFIFSKMNENDRFSDINATSLKLILSLSEDKRLALLISSDLSNVDKKYLLDLIVSFDIDNAVKLIEKINSLYLDLNDKDIGYIITGSKFNIKDRFILLTKLDNYIKNGNNLLLTYFKDVFYEDLIELKSIKEIFNQYNYRFLLLNKMPSDKILLNYSLEDLPIILKDRSDESLQDNIGIILKECFKDNYDINRFMKYLSKGNVFNDDIKINVLSQVKSVSFKGNYYYSGEDNNYMIDNVELSIMDIIHVVNSISVNKLIKYLNNTDKKFRRNDINHYIVNNLMDYRKLSYEEFVKLDSHYGMILLNKLTINELIDEIGKHNTLIRYIRNDNSSSIDLELLSKVSIDSGYIPSVEEIRKYKDLRNNKYIMEYLINNNELSAIDYVLDNLGYDDLILKAFDKGYKIEKVPECDIRSTAYLEEAIITGKYDLIKNKVKTYSSKSINILLDMVSNNDYNEDAINKYFMETININYRVIDYLLSQDIVPNKGFIYSVSNLRDKSVQNKLLLKIIDKNPYLIKDLKKIKISSDDYIMLSKKAIDKDIKIVEQLEIDNDDVYKYAIDLGYVPSEDVLRKNVYIKMSDSMILKALDIDCNYIIYYSGTNELVFKKALDMGYIPNEKDLMIRRNLSNDKNIMLSAVKNDVSLVKYYNGFDEEIWRYVLEKNSSLVNYYNGGNSNIWKIALDNDYSVIKYYNGLDNELFMYCIDKNIDSVQYIKTPNSIVYEYALNKGYKPVLEHLINNSYLADNKYIMMAAVSKNPEYIKYYSGNSVGVWYKALDMDVNMINFYKGRDIRVYMYALNKGFMFDESTLINNPFITSNDELMKLAISKKPELIIYYTGNKFNDLVSLTNYSKEIPWDVLKFYQYDQLLLINNFDLLKDILDKSNISLDKFIQYSFANSNNWLMDIINIYNDNKVDEFIRVKEYFFKYYYKNSDTAVSDINNFNDILNNYVRYPELCVNILNKKDISFDDVRKIEFLFNRNNSLSKEDRPKNIEDFSNIGIMFKEKYNKILNNVNDIDNLKEVICNVLFNNTYENIKKYLVVYGNTLEMKKLKFNNKNSNLIDDLVSEMTIYTSLMESIVNYSNFDDLKDMSMRLLHNFDLALECSTYFNQFELKMKYLYEVDLEENLTKVDNIKDYDKYIDRELTSKYGVETIDFSSKDYVLLAHAQSVFYETVDDLVNGVASANSNFICLSAISYRNQIYHHNNFSPIIFGYDNIPDGSFIASSISNMGSNARIYKNSSEVRDIDRKQRGILETSSSVLGDNSEILCYREGLKPSYIILPGGRNATNEEIAIAKKYNLKFVKTQKIGKSIDNPTKIEYVKNKEKDSDVNIEEITKLKNTLLDVMSSKNKVPRKIAIFSDAHALYEPTLAILEDARLKGIDEIYSLGDNIGTGPNPKEVLDLLDEYNVKSLIGNHELYMLNGVDGFIEHFNKVGGYRSALRNSTWTRSKLTDSQISNIKMYPKTIELLLGGKKIMLCHSTKDFNSDKVTVDRKQFDQVLQGHIHFEDTYKNLHTVRGVGIGTPDTNKAHYIILTETDNGFDMEKVYVDYDNINLGHSINISDLDNRDKDKINTWTGVRRR